MNAYSGKEPYVFVSYSHYDTESVTKIIIELKREMCRVWYDEGLTPGESWNDELAEKLKNAECIIVALTKNSIASAYVKTEINYAISKNIKIIPVFMEKVELPAGLEMMLSSTQFFNMYDCDFDTAISKLIPCLPDKIFSSRKAPFFESDGYAFYLKTQSVYPNPDSDKTLDGFEIICKSNSGEEKSLFDFTVPAAYDADYVLTQCKTVKDDYFVGEIRGINIFNILAKCTLNYPLYGPDFDMLMIFAMRIPKNGFPTVRLIDYQYMHVMQSYPTEGLDVDKSPWGCFIDELCIKKLNLIN